MKLDRCLVAAFAVSSWAGSEDPTQGQSLSKRHDTVRLPFSTSGRDIIDAGGSKVLYAGTNWPAHQELMIPEGLQYQPISEIVNKIKGFGLNSVRLTYATQMVDEIYDLGHDPSLKETVFNALGHDQGSKVLQQILTKNPQFTADTTRFQIFDAVAAELARQKLILHLDNHVSKATWCCLPGDGNGWFGESSFDVGKWRRGWVYMARHAAQHWPTFASVGLRNELRSSVFKAAEPYDWYTWFVHMNETATAIHETAPDALIFFGGRESDTAMGLIPRGGPLTGTPFTSTSGKVEYFIPDRFPYKNKIVLEAHKYDLFHYGGPCFLFDWDMKFNVGFQGIDASSPTTKYVFPMVLTEFGFPHDGKAYQRPYAQCLTDFVVNQQIGFMQWDIVGGYYIRQGKFDYEEKWGLLTHNWTAVRNAVSVENTLARMVAAARKYVGQEDKLDL